MFAEARLTLAPLTDFDLGLLAASLVGFVGWRAHALTAPGALAAIFVGTATFTGLGVPGAIVLMAFFVPSIALSRVGAEKKKQLVDVGKHGARDAGQVLANGGVAAVCALLALGGDPRAFVAFAGAFAAATADTWGTEIGTLVAQKPRSILTGAPVGAGLSGGVTAAGTSAEFAGALFIALVALFFGATHLGLRDAAAIAIGGVGGALIDSLLGASVQSLRWCAHCRRRCETEPHICGANTQPLRGFTWVTNDIVNLCATLGGALLAYAVVAL